MLKITVQKNDAGSTLVLEGKLVGAWVAEVETCWQAERANAKKVWLDLNGVTFIDAEGKTLLAKLYREGATLASRGCLIRAIIAQVCGKPDDEAAQQSAPHS